VKTGLGAAVFLLSLFVMRRVLVSTGALDPWSAFLFVTSSVGVSFGGFLFLEAAFDAHRDQVKRELEMLRRELAESRVSSPPESSSERSSPPRF
jgi:hypothetical protein